MGPPAAVMRWAPVVASLRVHEVAPTRFNTVSGEPPELEYDPENSPEEILARTIEAIFEDLDEDDAEGEQQANATAEALDDDYYNHWRENNPFELGHLVVMEVDEQPGVLRGAPDLRWVVTFVRGGRVFMEQGLHAGCTFEHFEGCLTANPRERDVGLGLLSPVDPRQAEWWYGIERCQARASAIEEETGQTAACLALDWLLPGTIEAGWSWSGGVGDGVVGIDLLRELIPEAATSGRSSAEPPASPPNYAGLVEAFEAGDEAARDAILRAWHERVLPIGPIERAALPLAEQRAYEVTERFLAELAPMLRNSDRYLVVQPDLRIEGHGPPGSETIGYFRPHLPPGLLPIYDAAGFTGSVRDFVRKGADRQIETGPTDALSHADLQGFLEVRLFIPTADAVQRQNGLAIAPLQGHELATAALRSGTPVRIEEIAFDGHMTKARVTAPIFLAPDRIDPENLDLDFYYRLEDGVWETDDGSSFHHGGDED